jgi:hypothetical protein
MSSDNAEIAEPSIFASEGNNIRATLTSSSSVSVPSKSNSWTSKKGNKASNRFPTSSICNNNSDLVLRQAEALKQAIKEAKKAEEKRLFIIEIEKNPLRAKELEDRFSVQRKLDQERLLQLKNDYVSIKEAVAKGDVSIVERNETRNYIPPIKTMTINRFAGLETEQDLVLHKSVCDKLHKLEDRNKKYNDRNLPKLNIEAEKNKLELLMQKQDVLSKMIDLQRQGFGDHSQNTRRSSSANSVCSGFTSKTSSTNYSWASFGSGKKNFSSVHENKAIQHKNKQANVFIPPLRIQEGL